MLLILAKYNYTHKRAEGDVEQAGVIFKKTNPTFCMWCPIVVGPEFKNFMLPVHFSQGLRKL